MEALFVFLPFAIVAFNLMRAWRKRDQSGIFWLAVACTAVLLCAALFTAWVFLSRGEAVLTLKRTIPHFAPWKVLFVAACLCLATVLVSWFGSAFCLYRKIKGWQTVLLLNMALGILEAVLLFRALWAS